MEPAPSNNLSYSQNNPDRNNRNEEKEFFGDLDKKTQHKSCCTCSTMIILFLVLLIVLSGIVAYLYWQISRVQEKRETSLPSQGALESFQEKIKKIKVDESGQFKLIIAEEEITALLSEGITTQNLILKEISTGINSENIIIYGKLTKPLSSDVTITGIPEAAEGKLVLKITSIVAGKLTLPAILTKSIANSISGAISHKLDSLYKDYQVLDVSLKENELIIYGENK